MARRRSRKSIDWNRSLPWLIVFGIVAVVVFAAFAPTGKFYTGTLVESQGVQYVADANGNLRTDVTAEQCDLWGGTLEAGTCDDEGTSTSRASCESNNACFATHRLGQITGSNDWEWEWISDDFSLEKVIELQSYNYANDGETATLFESNPELTDFVPSDDYDLVSTTSEDWCNDLNQAAGGGAQGVTKFYIDLDTNEIIDRAKWRQITQGSIHSSVSENLYQVGEFKWETPPFVWSGKCRIEVTEELAPANPQACTNTGGIWTNREYTWDGVCVRYWADGDTTADLNDPVNPDFTTQNVCEASRCSDLQTGEVYNLPGGPCSNAGHRWGQYGIWDYRCSDETTTLTSELSCISESYCDLTTDAGQIEQDVIGWWKLDSNTRDSSPNGIHGSPSGTTTTIGVQYSDEAISGKSLSANYVTVAGDTTVMRPSEFSVESWVKTPSDLSSSDQFYNILIKDNAWRIFFHSTDSWDTYSLHAQVRKGLSTESSATAISSTLNKNTWYHFVSTWKDDTVKLYVDGTLESSISQSGLNPQRDVSSILIGKAGFQGKLDEVRYYDRALTASEVTLRYETNADSDRDGIKDLVDNCDNDVNANQADADGDGIGDACDSNTDADRDGVDDGSDNCVGLYNPGQADLDSDNQGDACDSDLDGDNVANTDDNCPLDSGAQTDTDSDGAGDVCDTDDDGDGVLDTSDTFPLDSSESRDSDEDNVGDNADQCSGTEADATVDASGCSAEQLAAAADADGDGVDDTLDNCPSDANADQADFDSDNQGDVCDVDDDGDGVIDVADNCAETASGAAVDSAGCSVAQMGDADGDGVIDANDLCSGTVGTADADGCGPTQSYWGGPGTPTEEGLAAGTKNIEVTRYLFDNQGRLDMDLKSNAEITNALVLTKIKIRDANDQLVEDIIMTSRVDWSADETQTVLDVSNAPMIESGQSYEIGVNVWSGFVGSPGWTIYSNNIKLSGTAQ